MGLLIMKQPLPNARYIHHKLLFTQRKKDPQQDQQVHDQKDAVDPGRRGVGTLRPNAVETIAVLALTVVPSIGMRCR